ncbi:MAG: prepilin-type N-terminal cleavage/methylation domain-containing protein [Gammaproteobacteria bacterium]
MRTPPTQIHRPRRARRGFNLLEMLIALALTAALMAATMVALVVPGFSVRDPSRRGRRRCLVIRRLQVNYG